MNLYEIVSIYAAVTHLGCRAPGGGFDSRGRLGVITVLFSFFGSLDPVFPEAAKERVLAVGDQCGTLHQTPAADSPMPPSVAAFVISCCGSFPIPSTCARIRGFQRERVVRFRLHLFYQMMYRSGSFGVTLFLQACRLFSINRRL